jgi:hypothetical protein
MGLRGTSVAASDVHFAFLAAFIRGAVLEPVNGYGFVFTALRRALVCTLRWRVRLCATFARICTVYMHTAFVKQFQPNVYTADGAHAPLTI